MSDKIDAVARLRKYVREAEPGAVLDYTSVEAATGIAMAPKSGGRTLLRRALIAEKRQFETIWGSGVRLSSAENAVTFSENAIIGVARKADKAKRRIGALVQAHGEEMTDRDRQRVLTHASFLSAVDLAKALASQPKKLTG